MALFHAYFYGMVCFAPSPNDTDTVSTKPTVCGHDRDVLLWALEMDRDDLEWLLCDCGCEDSKVPTIRAIRDPAKLAAILVDEGRRLNFSIDRCYIGVDLNIYAHHKHIRIRDGKNLSRPLGVDLSMLQARILLLQWLHLPNGARKDAEMALRGDV